MNISSPTLTHVNIRESATGKPQQNACIERFNRTVRSEWIGQYIFESIEEAQDQATEWLVLCRGWLPCDRGATGRQTNHCSRWRRLDRKWLGRQGPFQSLINRRLHQEPERIPAYLSGKLHSSPSSRANVLTAPESFLVRLGHQSKGFEISPFDVVPPIPWNTESPNSGRMARMWSKMSA